MSGNDSEQEQQANRKRGAARNIAAAAGGLSVGGLAQRETLEGLIDDARSHGEDETSIADSSLDVFEELDSTYRPEAQTPEEDAAPALPGLSFEEPDDPTAIQIEPVNIPPVEIATPGTDSSPLDEMASLSPEIDEIVDDEIRFDLDDDPDEDDLEIVL
ncbi:MAG: hypothetical protein R3A46_11260 [Thermomicrobiales bacterium]